MKVKALSSAGRAVTEAMELPADLLTDEPVLFMTGCKKLLIENQHALLEYGPKRIRCNTGAGMMTVEGEGLEIEHLKDGAMEIRGKIARLSYE